MTKSANPFDIVKHINNKSELDFDIADYTPWMVNAALSNHMQTVHYANQMNQYYDLPNKMQYDFLYHGIQKGSRYGKWNKKETTHKETDINNVCELYSVNARIAETYLSMMTEEQLQYIRGMKGGRYGKHGGGRD